MRNNDSLKELLRILSLGRHLDNGERQKLNCDVGKKYTLVKLDKILEGCPLIESVFRDVSYSAKIEQRIGL